MNNTNVNIDEETISKVGLQLSDESINAHISPDARVFSYPHLDNVYIMENDLYGNKMPQGSCFLAFMGNHGLVGKHLKLETLRTATLDDIRNMVTSNQEG